MEEKKMAKCEACGKEVPEFQLNKYNECRACQFEEKSNDMCVGDLNSK